MRLRFGGEEKQIDCWFWSMTHRATQDLFGHAHVLPLTNETNKNSKLGCSTSAFAILTLCKSTWRMQSKWSLCKCCHAQTGRWTCLRENGSCFGSFRWRWDILAWLLDQWFYFILTVYLVREAAVVCIRAFTAGRLKVPSQPGPCYTESCPVCCTLVSKLQG